jgi:C1A family cysteine protease
MRTRLSRYGWIPDLPDFRDLLYKTPRKPARLPSSVDLRAGCPAVYDQGKLGSCTAHAISAAIEFDQRKQQLAEPFAPSRLFIYYNERAIQGNTAADTGAMLRDGIKSVASQGTCPETLWPYKIEKLRKLRRRNVIRPAAYIRPCNTAASRKAWCS